MRGGLYRGAGIDVRRATHEVALGISGLAAPLAPRRLRVVGAALALELHVGDAAGLPIARAKIQLDLAPGPVR